MVPDGWVQLALGQVATLQRGFDLPSSMRKEGAVPIVSSSGITGFHDLAMVKGPGVVTGRYGTVGEVFFIQHDFWPLNTSLWVKDFHGNNPKYVFYLLSTLNFKQFSDKTGVPGVNRNDLHTLKVILPPPNEQDLIVEILSTWDRAIDKAEEIVRNCEIKKRALEQQLLAAPGRIGSRSPCEFRRLSEVAEIYDGTHMTPDYKEEGVPFYSVEHVTKNDFSDTKFISREVFEQENKRVRIEKGDVLMTRIGDIGTAKYVDWDVEASFYVSLALIKPRASVDGCFLSHYIRTRAFQRELHNRTIHVAFPKKINLGEIGECLIAIPSLDEQMRLAEILSKAEFEVSRLIRQVSLLKEEKRALMQQLLVGKRRVNIGETTESVRALG